MKTCYSVVTIAITMLVAGCATNAGPVGPSAVYEGATEKTVAFQCRSGYILACESKRTGRIKFGRIGNKNLDSCACLPDSEIITETRLPEFH